MKLVSTILFHVYSLLAIALLALMAFNQAAFFNAAFTVLRAQTIALISLVQRMAGT